MSAVPRRSLFSGLFAIIGSALAGGVSASAAADLKVGDRATKERLLNERNEWRHYKYVVGGNASDYKLEKTLLKTRTASLLELLRDGIGCENWECDGKNCCTYDAGHGKRTIYASIIVDSEFRLELRKTL